MSVVFDHRDPGTSEDAWVQAAPWQDAEQLTLRGERLVVLAAHPDDETLGAGGLIALAAGRGIPVGVIVVTDGAADGGDVARTRRHELVDALHDLGGDCAVHFLGIADGGVREAADDVRRSLRALIPTGTAGSITIAVPWWGDGHRDHRVLGELALEFAASGARVLGYPIWLWHWGDPGAVDAADWRVLPLDTSTRAAKARALARHASQLTARSDAPGDEAILHTGMLRHFERPFEVFIEPASLAADSTPVTAFDERYARRPDPWGVDERWYELRKRDLLLASLPRPVVARALEIGCGTGALTERLAERALDVVAVDVSPHAVARARDRTDGAAHVRVDVLDIRAHWPEGRFDLIVLSEVGYYWSPSDLSDVLDRIENALTDDGIAVLCHWRHPIADAPQTGDAVHAELAARGVLLPLVRHVEEDFLLDVFARRGAASVARETGLLA